MASLEEDVPDMSQSKPAPDECAGENHAEPIPSTPATTSSDVGSSEGDREVKSHSPSALTFDTTNQELSDLDKIELSLGPHNAQQKQHETSLGNITKRDPKPNWLAKISEQSSKTRNYIATIRGLYEDLEVARENPSQRRENLSQLLASQALTPVDELQAKLEEKDSVIRQREEELREKTKEVEDLKRELESLKSVLQQGV